MAEPLIVVVNDRVLRRTLTGVGHYASQVLLHLPEVDRQIRAEPFLHARILRRAWRDPNGPAVTGAFDPRSVDSPAAPAAALARQPRDVGSSRKPWWVRRIGQGAYAGLFRLLSGRYALYHEPNHIPIRCGLPTITTIHDLSVLVHPEWHPADRVRWYEREFEAGVRQTRRFIAASEFTKRELVSRLGLAPDRIDVTYQAPRPAFLSVDAAAARRTLAALDLPSRFFLYVGTLEPRKNLAGLIDAFEALPPNIRARHPLVIAGPWGWSLEALRERIQRRALGSSVRLLGYMSDEQLAGLYSTCTAFVWPTLYEGFGMPPLEAMACGAPVIVSDVASVPEVVGDAGVLLDPSKPEAWVAAMRRMAEDDAWREDLIERGIARAATFSWKRCAIQTAAAYRATLSSSHA